MVQTKEQRMIYKVKFIEKLGGEENYKKYMSERVLQSYYRKKLQNIDKPMNPTGRPKKEKVNVEEIKKLLQEKYKRESI